MRTLTLSNGPYQADLQIEGKSKAEALDRLKNRLLQCGDDALDGVEITVAYKEIRRIVREGGVWAVEICENGCGQTEEFADRVAAITRFLDLVAGKGEHWD